MEFTGSRTRSNLLRAYAGECQAVMRYYLAASKAKTLHNNLIERVFAFTADQEREHAEVFFNLLNGQPRESLKLDGAYPIGNIPDVLGLLREAQRNELNEYNTEYATFADISDQEGYSNIAVTFRNIAKIEQTHADRFARFADMLEQGMLHAAEGEAKWLCLNCGHIHTGTNAPQKCPVCSHDIGYFIRDELVPFR